VKRLIAAGAGVLLCLAGVAACSSSASTVYVNSSRVKAKGTEWHQQGSSDTWVLWYLLYLSNGQTMRITQSYWNSAQPGYSTAAYAATASGSVLASEQEESAESEQEDSDLEIEDAEAASEQEYDSETESDSDITDDTEEDFSDDDDESFVAGNMTVTIRVLDWSLAVAGVGTS
jgi:hypothetical protein